MSARKLKSPWVAVDGSIFTVHKYVVKVESRKDLKAPDSIAFNLGEELADHVADLHNEWLAKINPHFFQELP